ncbi:MAG: type 1 glutamine amidotransferase [Solirubrobacteraceae bacterium]
MRVLALIHHEVAGTGVFAGEIERLGHELDTWIPSAQPIPRPLCDYGALIAFGGGMQADQEDLHPWLAAALDALREALRRDLPALGVCLGGQMLARAAGGDVGPAPRAECGWREVELTDDAAGDPLLGGLPRRLQVFQWHSYSFGLPSGATPLASSEVCLQAFRVGERAWGLQWHPEVTAESVLLWGREYPPEPDGVPVLVDLDALKEEVARRIEATNADGRALCARFLAAAEAEA